MNCCVVDSPIGKLTLWANGEGSALASIAFGEKPEAQGRRPDTPLLQKAAAQLEEYFGGKRKEFDLPLDPQGTPFQQSCRQALGTIPYGRTRSYGDIARQMGSPKAARAVGMANNRNPLPIVIPCHRVVGSSGKLVGYAGGLDIKEKLLKLEAQNSSWVEFGKKELDFLCKTDPALAKVIRAVPPPDYQMYPHLFYGLVHSIVGQQISSRAFAGIWQRAQSLWGEITPENLLRLSVEELCSAGISRRKAEYIRCGAQAAVAGSLDPKKLAQLDDQQAVEELCRLKGVGLWTAEMLLIFGLGRRDVLSFGDFGIRRGLCRLHGIAEEALTKEDFEHWRKKYSPHGTVAGLYLWAVGNSPAWPPAWSGWEE